MSEVGVLDKVMAILHTFRDGSTRLQPPTVAQQLGFAPPTAYRLMKSMAEHGLLDHDTDGYRLGMTLLNLGARVADGLDLAQMARRHLVKLRDDTAENAELHLRHGAMRVPIEVMTSPQNLRPMGQVGVPWPLHGGASSKVLLAWLPEAERRDLIRASLAANPPDRTFDVEAWERELARTREHGWASSDGEREKGVSSVAAPVYDRTGHVAAAMVASAPTSRLGRAATRSKVARQVVAAADRLSQAIGADIDTTRRLA